MFPRHSGSVTRKFRPRLDEFEVRAACGSLLGDLEWPTGDLSLDTTASTATIRPLSLDAPPEESDGGSTLASIAPRPASEGPADSRPTGLTEEPTAPVDTWGAVSPISPVPIEPLAIPPQMASRVRAMEVRSTFTSGQVANYMKIGLSKEGNIVSLESPAGEEHIFIGTTAEGYSLSSVANGAETNHGYDAGHEQSGFLPATIYQPNGRNQLPLIINRKTTDGVFRLTQSFSRNAANREFSITMTVKNLSAATRADVRLSRYFDGDIAGLFSNRYARTGDAVWGWNDISEADATNSRSLMLVAAKPAIAHKTYVQTFANLDATENKTDPPSEVTPAGPTDLSGRITYFLGAMTPGAKIVVKFTYRVG